MLAEWMVPVMDLALVTGVGVVSPMAFRKGLLSWLMVSAGVACSLAAPSGRSAALWLAPWGLLVFWELVIALRARSLVGIVLAGFGLTAVGALVASRLEVTLFAIPEPIVKLTALHFTYAGVATLGLSQRLLDDARTPWNRACQWLVMGAPPVVALGFVTQAAVFQVGGALLMSLGVLGVAIGLWRLSNGRRGLVRALLRLAAASPWVAMGLGVAWAANQYWPAVPALTVPDMVPTHGALNAFGFASSAHLACWLEERLTER